MQMTPVDCRLEIDPANSEESAAFAKKQRAFDALAAEVGEHGWSGVAVADILRRSGMSRKTFYGLFLNREDCFLQAYDAAVARVRRTVSAAYHEADGQPLRQRVERGLAAFLECCAAEPDYARMCLVEVMAAGPGARARRDAAVMEFARFLEFPRERARGATAPSLVCEAIVGGIYAIISSRIARGETDELPELLDDLMDAGLGQLLDRDAPI